jgi:Pvc16 N-terminal domain
MSNSLAIAAVTSTLRFILDRALQATHPGPVGGAGVTTLRPDRLTDTTLVTTPGINVYLYDVRPNHAWNPRDLPTRREDGSLMRRPTAALDLHYLLTCYGEDESLDAQRLLGRAVLALAVTPVLTRDVVSAAMTTYSSETETAFLADADLADQVERVKVAPFTLTVEEMAKLWGLFQTPHQLSLTYVATAALLEADVMPRTALPVRRSSITILAGGAPRLASVRTDPQDEPAVHGATLVLEGSGLLAPPGADTTVQVGAATLDPENGATALELRVTLGDSVPAGLHGLRVVHTRPAAGGVPARVVATSNLLPLLVRPTVTVQDTDPQILLGVAPPLQPGQRPTVALSRLVPGPPDSPDALTIRLAPVPPGDPPQSTLTLDPTDVPAGQWLVRVEVDGVESVPELVDEAYGAPALTLP